MRRTKIVASIGPASWDEPVLRKVIAAGADVIRVNLSHGDPDTQLALVDRVRRVSADDHRAVGVLVDLPGPKLRMAPFPDRGRPGGPRRPARAALRRARERRRDHRRRPRPARGC